MTLGVMAQYFAFGLFSLIAIAGALGMTTTMSMFRSGIFLMASFIGVAGLFILLLADLLGLLQIMMYIGGMLVMILFMVLFSHDPGGAMMAEMDLPLIERFFSLGLTPLKDPEPTEDSSEGSQESESDAEESADQNESAGHEGMDHEGMDHGDMDMSMTTPIKTPAAILAVISGVLLVGLILLRPSWPVSQDVPDPDSAGRIGALLMDKYMIAFEGAGLLILLGIFGAVFISRPGRFPDSPDRESCVAVDELPAPIEAESLPSENGGDTS